MIAGNNQIILIVLKIVGRKPHSFISGINRPYGFANPHLTVVLTNYQQIIRGHLILPHIVRQLNHTDKFFLLTSQLTLCHRRAHHHFHRRLS